MSDNTLAIIGNGFDLNHGLDTSFKSFYSSLPTALKEDWDNYMNKYNIPNETWHDFETIISTITNDIFNGYFDTYLKDKSGKEREIDKQKYEEEIEKVNILYQKVYYEFRNFIKKQNNDHVNINISLSNYIKKEAPVISFNYTDLIKKYSNNIDYIHGSIDENFLVFGYSRRTEYDHIEPKAAIYDKQKFRELLHYARFLMKDYDISNNKLEPYVDEYLPHLLQSHTGKGGWLFEYPKEFVERCNEYLQNNKNIYDFNFESHPYISQELQDEARIYRLEKMTRPLSDYFETLFLSKNGYQNVNLLDSPFDHSKVNRLVIVGHGLEADIELFESLFRELSNLKEVVLFVYEGEWEKEIERKKKVLTKLTDCKIVLEKY